MNKLELALLCMPLAACAPILQGSECFTTPVSVSVPSKTDLATPRIGVKHYHGTDEIAGWSMTWPIGKARTDGKCREENPDIRSTADHKVRYSITRLKCDTDGDGIRDAGRIYRTGRGETTPYMDVLGLKSPYDTKLCIFRLYNKDQGTGAMNFKDSRPKPCEQPGTWTWDDQD